MKELIIRHQAVWRWDKDPQDLLDMWFDYENDIDAEIISIIKHLRANGIPTYLATNQEKYRTTYMREVMFPNDFDDILASSDLGYTKKESGYWQQALRRISITVPDIQPAEILFFDDSQDSIEGALTAGISAYLYKNPGQIRKLIDM